MDPDARGQGGEGGCRRLLWLLLAFSALALLGETRVFLKKYLLPAFQTPDRFIEDFQYFYEFGSKCATDAAAMYSNSSGHGTLILRSGRRVATPYPPVSALMLSPLSWLPKPVAFAINGVVVLVSALLALLAFMRLLGDGRGPPPSALEKAAVLLVLVSAGPVFTDLIFGSFNSFILLLCVLVLGLVDRGFDLLGAFVLSIAVWLRVYPLLLVVLALASRHPRDFVAGLLLGLLGMPLLCLPLIPAGTYADFFLHILPDYSAQTTLHVLNQSLPAVMTRLGLGVSLERYFSYEHVLIPSGIRFVLWGVAGMLILLVGRMLRRRVVGPAEGGAMLLALIPLFTPIGWGNVYVMVLPLIILSWFALPQGRRWGIGLGLAATAAIFVPSYHVFRFASKPSIWIHLLYARYALASAVLFATVAIGFLRSSRRTTPTAPVFERVVGVRKCCD